jgi:predicted DNA-binding protein (UPF0278 family)
VLAALYPQEDSWYSFSEFNVLQSGQPPSTYAGKAFNTHIPTYYIEMEIKCFGPASMYKESERYLQYQLNHDMKLKVDLSCA